MALPTPLAASSARPMNAEMNVTPMLDVMLVLLIIFMAAITNRMVLPAHLPDPDPVAHRSEIVPIVLEVGTRGYYAVNQQVVPADSLQARLRAIYDGRPDKRIILRGARDATYQEVLRAMDIARGAGVTVIGIDSRARDATDERRDRPHER
jgi:biopolymer transport protein TolR